MDDDPVPYFPLQLNLDSRSAAPPFDPFYQTIDETRNQGGVGGNQSHAYYASVGKPSPPHYDTVADQSHPHYATVGDRNPAHYSGDQNPTHYSGDQNPTHYTDDRNPAHYLDGRNPAQYSDDRNPAYYSDIKEHTPPPYASVMDQHHPHYAVVGNQNRSHSSLVGGRPNPPQRHDYSDTQFINNDIYASIEEANAEEGDLHSYDSEEGDIRSYGSHYEETQKPNVQRLSQEIMVQRLSFNDEDRWVCIICMIYSFSNKMQSSAVIMCSGITWYYKHHFNDESWICIRVLTHKMTPHILSERVSSEVSFVRILKKFDHVITAPHCMFMVLLCPCCWGHGMGPISFIPTHQNTYRYSAVPL